MEWKTRLGTLLSIVLALSALAVACLVTAFVRREREHPDLIEIPPDEAGWEDHQRYRAAKNRHGTGGWLSWMPHFRNEQTRSRPR